MSDRDYIVIGAGSAGCALACELVRSGKRVLVLEAGGSDRSPVIKLPAGVLRACAKYDWGYLAQPDPSRNGARERWLRGKVLGGSSSINGTVYVRGAAEDFDRWADHCGGQGAWSARDVMPIFRDLEASDQDGSLRGRDGPLHVRTVRRPHVLTRAFIESACSAGDSFNTDYNGSSQHGVSYAQFTQRRGLRCSAADAFLKPVLRRKNVKLLLNAVAERIEIENGRAVAVWFSHKGKRLRAAARDIVLCAGALNSPKLLMLSGIGDSQELRRHQIDVVIDLPGVGRHLKDHQYLQLDYKTRVPTFNPTEGLLQRLGILARFLVSGEGPISNLIESVAFLKTSACELKPDFQVFFTAVGTSRSPDGGWQVAPFPSIAVVLAYSYPVSSGCVRLATRHAGDPPVIDYPLLGSRSDVEGLIRAIGVVRRIMKTEPIASLVEEELAPGASMRDAAALEAFVRGHTGICKHSIGTCRMGLGADAVVGPDLRVRGTQNLWVADASIMPDAMSGNTNAACMMIGAKLGRQLVAGNA